MKEDKLIQDWLNEETSTEEKAQVERFISLTEKLESPSKTSKDQAWDSLMAKINLESSDNERVIQPPKTENIKLYWMAAAVLVLIALFGYLNNSNKLITLSAQVGEIANITLPDNSVVTLNSGSTLSYKEKGFNQNRRVILKGEAFFEVTPGETFRVESEGVNVKVIGTSFNLFNRETGFKVSVFTGKVEVSSEDNTVLLSKGDEAKLENGRLSVDQFNMSQTATWRVGSFYFDGEPLREVVKELERQFNIEIEVKADISQRFYSGYFSKANMTEALQLVFVPMGLSVETNGNLVTIE